MNILVPLSPRAGSPVDHDVIARALATLFPPPHRPPAAHGFVAGALARGRHFYEQVVELTHDRPYVPIGIVLICLASAACYAASSVLQQREARAAPPEMAMRLGLIGHLIRRPLWLLGNLADIAGYALQFVALRTGSLALVQPLLVTGLVFALVAEAVLAGRRLLRDEWRWTVMTVAGLALFLAVSRPGPGDPRGSLLGWLVLGLATFGSVGTLVLSARALPRWRALCLGSATGILFGVVAALTESSAHLLDHGVLRALGHWQPYALLVCAGLGLMLSQSAFQAGDLKWSLPALTVIEPVTAILIGQLLFGEHISFRGLAPVGEVLSLALMARGVVGLSRAVAQEVPRTEAPGTV
ncbi:MAG: DMT family transporter [Solirubrobacteraceae bacterium]